MAEKIKKEKKPAARSSKPKASDLEYSVYGIDGKEAGKVSLPGEVFGLPWNADLVHQVAVSMESNARENIAHTKTRGEVSGTGKKPWRQKGTGRARHGSMRSPIWVGGGVAHGPRNDKNYARKVNRKMKAKALFTILSRKLKEGEVMFVNDISLSEAKSKKAKDVLSALGKVKGYEGIVGKRANAAYIAVLERNENVERGFRNFGHVHVDELRNVSPLDLLKYKYFVMARPEESVKVLQKKLENKRA